MNLQNALFDWDDADESDGNTAHIAEHGLTADKVEATLRDEKTSSS